jgi:KTSC domain-containing protein
MNRQPVYSSNVTSIGYDPQSQTLEVEFQNGAVYQYYNVPSALYGAFIEAPSKGQFLHANIRNQYPYSRV